MELHKSAKARLELGSKDRVLNLRERGALFLADGRKTRHEMQGLLQDDGSLLRKPIADGHLISSGQEGATTLLPSNKVSFQPPPVMPYVAPAAAAPAPPQSDHFEGKRSLATTRMFLFDICERMFVRKSLHWQLNCAIDCARRASAIP